MASSAHFESRTVHEHSGQSYKAQCWALLNSFETIHRKSLEHFCSILQGHAIMAMLRFPEVHADVPEDVGCSFEGQHVCR